jgi:O-antigen/teichoic acid export membrane protein
LSDAVRIRFSGFVIFAARIFSIFTGLAFTFVTTRTLTQSAFGAWSIINLIVSILTLGSTFIPFWSARYTARRFPGAMKLGLLANLIISIPMVVIGILVGVLLAPATNTSSLLFAYATILVVQSYIISSMDPVVSIRKTHTLGYAYATYELIKVLAVYILLWIFQIGIAGAITSLILANFGWMMVYMFVLRDLWSEPIDRKYLRQWINGSFLIIYSIGANLLTLLDVIILLSRGTTIAVSYYQVSVSITTPITFTAALSTALYPRMIRGGTSDDIELSWRITLLFALPLLIAVVTLSSSLLSILSSPRADYTVAYIVLSVLALRYFIVALNPIFDAVISGTEKLDERGAISFRETLKSRMFYSPTTIYIAYLIYLPTLWYALQFFTGNPLVIAEVTALIGLPVNIAITAGKFLIARGSMRFKFPLLSALKYGVTAGAMALIILILSYLHIIEQPMLTTTTIALFGAGAIVYFLILYYIEDEARTIIEAIRTMALARMRSFLSS